MSDETSAPSRSPRSSPRSPTPAAPTRIDDRRPFAGDERVGRDLDPEDNPEVEDARPDEITEPEDKRRRAKATAPSNPEEEDPA